MALQRRRVNCIRLGKMAAQLLLRVNCIRLGKMAAQLLLRAIAKPMTVYRETISRFVERQRHRYSLCSEE
jgi:hypothetical protein